MSRCGILAVEEKNSSIPPDFPILALTLPASSPGAGCSQRYRGWKMLWLTVTPCPPGIPGSHTACCVLSFPSISEIAITRGCPTPWHCPGRAVPGSLGGGPRGGVKPSPSGGPCRTTGGVTGSWSRVNGQLLLTGLPCRGSHRPGPHCALGYGQDGRGSFMSHRTSVQSCQCSMDCESSHL